MKKVKKLLVVTLACMMSLFMISGAAFATGSAGIQNGQADLELNKSKVAFAGHSWWVIGDANDGVYPNADHVTLLNADNDLGVSAFRSMSKTPSEDLTLYGANYYASNPTSMNNWATPVEYAGSTLQVKMDAIADSLPEKELNIISGRNLEGGGTYNNPSNDGIAGQGINDQKLWALSLKEWQTVKKEEVLEFDVHYWLRSPNTDTLSKFANKNGWLTGQGGLDPAKGTGGYDYAVRAALSLDLSSVLFTSDASENGGKSLAVPGGALVGTTQLTETVKFTVKDSSQKLTVKPSSSQSEEPSEALEFNYEDATTGENQYISCILTDDTGAVKHYGKLADSSNAANGSFTIPLTSVANGTYTLQIFSEKADDHLHTDFCSEPLTTKISVSAGKGAMIHEHSWNKSEYANNDTHHWHECETDLCTITDDSKKDGYAEHTFEWIIDKQATSTEAGSKHEECTVCKYAKDAITIPATGTTTPTDPSSPTDPQTPTVSDNNNPESEINEDVTQTGDNSHIVLWSALLIVSGIAVSCLIVKNRKKKYNQ